MTDRMGLSALMEIERQARTRARRIAIALGYATTNATDFKAYGGTWWLIGVAGGSRPMPEEVRGSSREAALDAAEKHFAGQLIGVPTPD